MPSTESPAAIASQRLAQSLLYEMGGPVEWRRLRTAHRQTRSTVADVVGVHRQTIYDWETGKKRPGLTSAQAYLSHLRELRAGEAGL
jgi:DNA-binding XRE family transcriptional regulator